jgi:hypothetical protein
VSVGTPLSLVMGILLIFGGLALFFLGNFKPELKRDSDNIYAILAIICGFIGVISFARKDFDESIEQLLLVGMAVFLMWENIKNRTPNALPTTSNKRDDDRGSRRPYRAERVNEYEEFGSSRGSGGLGGSRGGYEESYNDRTLPRRDDRSGREGRDSRRGGDDEFRGGREEFREEPRSIPERSSRSNRDDRDRSSRDNQRWDESSNSRESNRDNARESSSRENSSRENNSRGEERPRRRRPDEEGARPRRRARRVEDVNSEGEEIPAADYTEFTPLEEKPSNSGSSWGPQ